jgi:hypothetical protein
MACSVRRVLLLSIAQLLAGQLEAGCTVAKTLSLDSKSSSRVSAQSRV